MTSRMRSCLVLCITGGIACGKSELGRILNGMGFLVCDADREAHALMKKGTPVYRQVVEYFGEGILSDDGEIARPILGEIVFKNPADREALNRLVHPAVQKTLENWIAEKRKQKKDCAVLVPLLFESGMEKLDWDAIICVSSSEKMVSKRLEKRGLDPTEIGLRVGSQMPLAEKEQRSNYVICNDGTLGELKESARVTVHRIKAER